MIRAIERESQLGWGGFVALPPEVQTDLVGDYLARNLAPDWWKKVEKREKRSQAHRRQLAMRQLFGVTDGGH